MRRQPTGARRWVFFGGKGGNGKTTCAAAHAVRSAEEGRRVLVVSTDPAHSLGDVLGRRLGADPVGVPVRRGALRACELDADRALARWIAERRPALGAILLRGTILDRRDVDRFLELSLPGVDELLGLLEIERLGALDDYDDVVVDTAPTGHTLRLLATPALFLALAQALDAMQERHRILAAAFGRRARRDDAGEALIAELREAGERLRNRLRDRSRTELRWVVLPEEMSVAESTRALDALAAEGIAATDIVVNRLTPPPPSRCALCDGRRRVEARQIDAIRARWGGAVRLWGLSAQDRPPRGIAALRAVAASVTPLAPLRVRRSRPAAPRVGRPAAALPDAVRPAEPTRLLIVGGKGGVGKTTCAATIALAAASEAPDRRILLVSTDPAPSLGDVLGQAIGDMECRIAGGPDNFVAREIDAAREWRVRRARYRESIRQLFEAFTGGAADLTVDRAVVEELLELAPPGIDEVLAMLALREALVPEDGRETTTRRFDLVVVDSAPTGHTLRLLALPEQARDWLRRMMAVLLKYRAVGAFAPVAEELLRLSRGLGDLQRLLTTSSACGFVVVTRAEQLPSLETARLVDWLARHHISRRALIVNAVTPPECARCRSAARREAREIRAFTRRILRTPGGDIVVTDAVAPPPRGVAALRAWQRTWRVFGR